jgi:hypothetical protein
VERRDGQGVVGERLLNQRDSAHNSIDRQTRMTRAETIRRAGSAPRSLLGT